MNRLFLMFFLFSLTACAEIDRQKESLGPIEAGFCRHQCDEQYQQTHSDSLYKSCLRKCEATPSEPGKNPYFVALARPANNWNDTGIDIQPGESYQISVVGGQWYSNPYWTSPLGAGNSKYIASSSYLLPGAPEGALIGRVGAGPVFLIGNSAKTPDNSVGRLQVTVNDAPAGFGDNSGSLGLDIKKQ